MNNSNTDKQSNKTQPTTEQTNKWTTTLNNDKQQPTSNNNQQQANQPKSIDSIAIPVAHHSELVCKLLTYSYLQCVLR